MTYHVTGHGELTDAAWEALKPLLPATEGPGRPWRDHRQSDIVLPLGPHRLLFLPSPAQQLTATRASAQSSTSFPDRLARLTQR